MLGRSEGEGVMLNLKRGVDEEGLSARVSGCRKSWNDLWDGVN
jgi:hypothetical protein